TRNGTGAVGALHATMAIDLEAAFGAKAADLHLDGVERRLGQRSKLVACAGEKSAERVPGVGAAPEVFVDASSGMAVIALARRAQRRGRQRDLPGQRLDRRRAREPVRVAVRVAEWAFGVSGTAFRVEDEPARHTREAVPDRVEVVHRAAEVVVVGGFV